eukprot:scaffold104697_cov67-Phaeocystis_antarctica.AAC.3
MRASVAAARRPPPSKETYTMRSKCCGCYNSPGRYGRTPVASHHRPVSALRVEPWGKGGGAYRVLHAGEASRLEREAVRELSGGGGGRVVGDLGDLHAVPPAASVEELDRFAHLISLRSVV